MKPLSIALNFSQYSHLQKFLTLDSQRCLQTDQKFISSRSAEESDAEGVTCLVNQASLPRSWPSRESCPASFGQKNPRCDTACKDRGGKLDKNTAGLWKSTRLQTQHNRRKQKQICKSQKSWLTWCCPWICMVAIQLLVFYIIRTSYQHPLWLHSVTLQLEAVPVCNSPALILEFEL